MEGALSDRNQDALDRQTLEKISMIAEQAKNALLVGITAIRRLNAGPERDINPGSMVDQLGKLILMWDEIHIQVNKMMNASSTEMDPVGEPSTQTKYYH